MEDFADIAGIGIVGNRWIIPDTRFLKIDGIANEALLSTLQNDYNYRILKPFKTMHKSRPLFYTVVFVIFCA